MASIAPARPGSKPGQNTTRNAGQSPSSVKRPISSAKSSAKSTSSRPGSAKTTSSGTGHAQASLIKLNIRLLPPNLPEDAFIQQLSAHISPQTYDQIHSKYYVQGSYSTKPFEEPQYSRAYVQLAGPELADQFLKEVRGKSFIEPETGDSIVPMTARALYNRMPLHIASKGKQTAPGLKNNYFFQEFQKHKMGEGTFSTFSVLELARAQKAEARKERKSKHKKVEKKASAKNQAENKSAEASSKKKRGEIKKKSRKEKRKLKRIQEKAVLAGPEGKQTASASAEGRKAVSAGPEGKQTTSASAEGRKSAEPSEPSVSSDAKKSSRRIRAQKKADKSKGLPAPKTAQPKAAEKPHSDQQGDKDKKKKLKKKKPKASKEAQKGQSSQSPQPQPSQSQSAQSSQSQSAQPSQSQSAQSSQTSSRPSSASENPKPKPKRKKPPAKAKPESSNGKSSGPSTTSSNQSHDSAKPKAKKRDTPEHKAA